MKLEQFSSQDYSFTGLKSLLERDIKGMLVKVKENKFLVIIALCIVKLILQVFSITTIATIGCLLYGVKGFIKQKSEQILEKGLAYYLPLPIKNALLNRSLLDILCDMWFIPTMSLYVKTLMAPMLSNQQRGPEEAVKYLDPLEPRHRELFIRKGLAFLFPRKITKILLPKDYFQNPIIERALSKKESFLSFDHDDSGNESNDDQVKTEVEDNIPHLNSNDAGNHLVPVVKSVRQSMLPTTSKVSFRHPIQVIDMDNPTTTSPTIKKSKVLLSSHMLRNLKNMPGRLDPAWDNMKEYERMKNMKPISRSPSHNKLNVLSLIMNLKQFDVMKKVSKGTAYKISGASAALILAQLFFFKKTRKWTKNLLLLLTFSGGLVVLLGSLAYLFFSSKNRDDKKKLPYSQSQADFQLALKAREQEGGIEERHSEESLKD